MATVLKTVVGESSPWVRIPPSPPSCQPRDVQTGPKGLDLQRKMGRYAFSPVHPSTPASKGDWGHIGGTDQNAGGIMALTDIQVKAAKPAAKPYKLADAKGLYLYVAPSGLRSWRMKYRFCGVEKTLTFGPYPEVRLSEAREKRDAARALLRDGRDPGLEKRLAAAAGAQDAENHFRTVAIAWHELHKAKWSSTHAADVIGSLERDVFPALGGLPIAKITPGMVLETLRAVEQRPAIETARRLRQRMSGVFVYAIASGFGQSDPAAIVRSAMRPLPAKGRQPAIVDLEDAKKLLAEAEAAAASPVTKIASRLLALTAVRSNVLRRAEWTEFEQLDRAAPVWRIPAAKMKLTAARNVKSHPNATPFSRPISTP